MSSKPGQVEFVLRTPASDGGNLRQCSLSSARPSNGKRSSNEVGGNRLGKHRLMDYNNHPDTTLAEIHSLLRTAQARLEKRLR